MNSTVARRTRTDRTSLQATLRALVDDGIVTRDDAEQILHDQASEPGTQHPLSLIAQANLQRHDDPERLLTLEALTHWTADRYDLEYYRIDPLRIDSRQVTSVVPYAYAARAGILPLRVDDEQITVATADPSVRDWESDLAKVSGRRVRRVVANPEDIDRYLVEFYALSHSVTASEQERSGQGSNPAFHSLEQLMDLGRRGQLDANDSHVVNIVDWLLQYAFEQRASDIHMEPRRSGGRIRFRIDGVLHAVYEIPPSVMTAVTSRVKILGRMNVAEKRRPQDGRIKTRSPEGREVELRLSTMPTAFGEKLVMRVFDPDILVRDFDALGFEPDDQAAWQRMTTRPNGIVLVTGPTGSGKTTTLYSTLKHLATPEVNICTIEDPIELVEPSFNQMQVQPKIDVTFASGVRTVLRQDPDIVMVGEIRDLETAEIAIQAALTGHLVLSTLHTNDAPSAVTRLTELGIPAYLIRATLLGVVAQRLARQLCPECKRPAEPDPRTWDALAGGQRLAMPDQVFEPVGCPECRKTGYQGRVGLYEVMEMDEALTEAIRDDMDLEQLRALAIRRGTRPLRMSGAVKVAEGQTSLDEVLKVAPTALRP